jgi:hypothetical protein
MVKGGKMIRSPPDMHARWSCILHYSDLLLVVQQAVKYFMYQFNAQGKFTSTKLVELKKFTQKKLPAVKILMSLKNRVDTVTGIKIFV